MDTTTTPEHEPEEPDFLKLGSYADWYYALDIEDPDDRRLLYGGEDRADLYPPGSLPLG